MANQDYILVTSIPHTHLAGQEVWTKLIRNGTDMGYLNKNKYYDFNYQNIYTFNPRLALTKVKIPVKYFG